MRQIKQGSSDNIRIENANVKSITFDTILKTAVDLANLGIDFSLVTIVITLFKDSKIYNIYSGSLLPMLLMNDFYNANYTVLTQTTDVRKAISLDTLKYLVPASIDFEQVIQLRNADYLEVECTVGGNAFQANTDTSLSYIKLDYLEGIGLQAEIPIYRSSLIPSGQNEFIASLGENVSDVYLINQDLVDFKAPVISNVSLRSDRINYVKNSEDLISENIATFPDLTSSLARLQNFHLIRKDMDEVNLNITLNNPTAGKNWVVSRSWKGTNKIIRDGQRRAKKHAAKYRFKFS